MMNSKTAGQKAPGRSLASLGAEGTSSNGFTTDMSNSAPFFSQEFIRNALLISADHRRSIASQPPAALPSLYEQEERKNCRLDRKLPRTRFGRLLSRLFCMLQSRAVLRIS